MTKILVIEDEAVLRGSILQLLGFAGFEGIGAADGIEGIQLIQETMPAVVICDIRMPEMDGFEVIPAVRGIPDIADIPFIFLTAKADDINVEYGLQLGAAAYITKPFVYNDLIDTINQCIG